MIPWGYENRAARDGTTRRRARERGLRAQPCARDLRAAHAQNAQRQVARGRGTRHRAEPFNGDKGVQRRPQTVGRDCQQNCRVSGRVDGQSVRGMGGGQWAVVDMSLIEPHSHPCVECGAPVICFGSFCESESTSTDESGTPFLHCFDHLPSPLFELLSNR